VTATGNGSRYQLIDAQPKEANYYRLKMVDMDGRFKYSSIILLRSNGASIVLNTVRPNPVSNRLVASITLSKAQKVEVLLTDNFGRVVKNGWVTGVKGLNELTLNHLGNLANGIYFLKIQTTETMIEQKIIKAN
jgi:hypothetical protein